MDEEDEDFADECHDCGEDTCVCEDPWSEDGEMGCYFPGRCLMAFAEHMKWECHTAEMYRAYLAECKINSK